MRIQDQRCLFCYNVLNQGEKEYHPDCSKKIFGTKNPPLIDFKLTDVADLAIKVLGRSRSVTGVQPKLSLDMEKTKGKQYRFTIVGLWGNYILKPPHKDYPQMPEIEDLTMHLARLMGIKTAEHSLIRLKSGEISYLCKRFDRVNSNKIHTEDFAQLSNTLTERKYYSSMEKVGKVIMNYSDFSGNDLLRLFEITLFSFITGNSDMHLKNFSLIYTEDNEVMMAPAYDLLSTNLLLPEDKEELALPLNGKKHNLHRKDFDYFANYLNINIKSLEFIYSKFTERLKKIKDFTDLSFLSEKNKERYKELIRKRYVRLNLI